MNVVLERVKQGPGAAIHFVKDRLKKPEQSEVDRLAAGQGALLMMNGKKLAVYKDEAGTLHAMSPVCRHWACIVDWNPAEKTWDCPCHGSRYDAMGHVIHGPAKKDLQHEGIEG